MTLLTHIFSHRPHVIQLRNFCTMALSSLSFAITLVFIATVSFELFVFIVVLFVVDVDVSISLVVGF